MEKNWKIKEIVRKQEPSTSSAEFTKVYDRSVQVWNIFLFYVIFLFLFSDNLSSAVGFTDLVTIIVSSFHKTSATSHISELVTVRHRMLHDTNVLSTCE